MWLKKLALAYIHPTGMISKYVIVHPFSSPINFT